MYSRSIPHPESVMRMFLLYNFYRYTTTIQCLFVALLTEMSPGPYPGCAPVAVGVALGGDDGIQLGTFDGSRSLF